MPPKPSSPTTQKDIAKALGLAQSTVAWALNPKHQNKFPPETVKLIQKKAMELNYLPQRQARILRTGRSHTIGVVFYSSIYHAPLERIRSLARTAIQEGYQMATVDMNWFDDDIQAAEHHLLGLAVEGIVFCNARYDDQQALQSLIQQRQLPSVSMGSRGLPGDAADVDLHSISREMTRHHLTQGSRRLHLILPFHDGSLKQLIKGIPTGEWVAGFRDAISNVGGEVITDEGNAALFGLPTAFSSGRSAIRGVVHRPFKTSLHHDALDVGYHEARQLLGNLDEVDSLVCSNDHIAAGAITACIEAGVPVPAKVLVSGGDDSPFSRYCGVPITSIQHPSEDLAKWSVRRMIDLIEHPEKRSTPESQLFPCKLVTRRSTLRHP